jgi:hypothetical protein
MNFGNIQGLVNGTESVVFDYTVTGSAAASISTGNILNGNEDGWYTVILLHDASGTSYPKLNFNADTGNNYGVRGITGSNTTVADYNAASNAGILIGESTNGLQGFSVSRVYAKSGAVRLVNVNYVRLINGTTVNGVVCLGGVWNNTADNIVSIQVVDGGGTYLDVGTRLIVLKSNNFTNGTPTGIINTPYIQGSWVRVGSAITSSQSSVTFSGLDGDRDVIYRIITHTKNAAGYAFLRFNSDTSSNIGYQLLRGSNTTVDASRATNSLKFLTISTGNSCAEMILFAKTGFVRPSILTSTYGIATTTVEAVTTIGQVYNETSTNITSLVVACSSGNFTDGSQISIYALRPNG